MRRASGKFGFAAKNGRHDLACGVSQCQQAFTEADGSLLVVVNQVVRLAMGVKYWKNVKFKDKPSLMLKLTLREFDQMWHVHEIGW